MLFHFDNKRLNFVCITDIGGFFCQWFTVAGLVLLYFYTMNNVDADLVLLTCCEKPKEIPAGIAALSTVSLLRGDVSLQGRAAAVVGVESSALCQPWGSACGRARWASPAALMATAVALGLCRASG